MIAFSFLSLYQPYQGQRNQGRKFFFPDQGDVLEFVARGLNRNELGRLYEGESKESPPVAEYLVTHVPEDPYLQHIY